MKTISISCPKCHAANRYTSVELSAADGKVPCAACGHILSLVRKKATQPAQKATEKPQATAPLYAKEAAPTKAKEAAAPKAAEILPQQARPLRERLAPRADEPIQIQSSAQKVPSFILDQDQNGSHTIAPSRATEAVEALLQHSMKQHQPPAQLPTIDTLLQNVQASANAHTAGGQHIHIKADSLVFNLVSGRDPAVAERLIPQGTLPATLDTSHGAHLPTEPNTLSPAIRSEFNWTLASLVALTVLIIQLFYYLLFMR